MDEDTRNFVKACAVCSQHKSSHQAPVGLLQPLLIPHCPWSHGTLDFVTGLPLSDGNTVILIVVDRFSKMAHFVSLIKLPSAKEMAQLVLEHGLPMDMVSDRGSQFSSVLYSGESSTP